MPSIKKIKFTSIEKEVDIAYVVKLTQEATIYVDGRKYFGPIRCSIILDNKHIIESWLMHKGVRLNDTHINEAWEIFRHKFKQLMQFIRYNNKEEKNEHLQNEAIQEIIRMQTPDDK